MADQEVIGHVTPLKNVGFFLSKVKFQFCSFRKLFAGQNGFSKSHFFCCFLPDGHPFLEGSLALAPLMHVVLELEVLAGRKGSHHSYPYRIKSLLQCPNSVLQTTNRPFYHKTGRFLKFVLWMSLFQFSKGLLSQNCTAVTLQQLHT